MNGAAQLIGLLTSGLNEADVPFQLKVSDSETGYVRCDSGVLYLQACDFERAGTIIRRAHSAIGLALMDDIPLFCRRLDQGLGLAESPPGQESFGQHRCRLLSEGLVRVYEERLQSRDEQEKCILQIFAAHGIDPAEPHLNPGSTHRYSLPNIEISGKSATIARVSLPHASRSSFLEDSAGVIVGKLFGIVGGAVGLEVTFTLISLRVNLSSDTGVWVRPFTPASPVLRSS